MIIHKYNDYEKTVIIIRVYVVADGGNG